MASEPTNDESFFVGESGGYYGSVRGESPGSASPPSSAPLIVPQPINVAKMSGSGGGLHSHSQHSHQPARKYQCKMCPQVNICPAWLRNRLKSAGLEPVFSHTKKSFSTNIAIKIKIKTNLLARAFGHSGLTKLVLIL